MKKCLEVYNYGPVTHFSSVNLYYTGVSCDERAFKPASYNGSSPLSVYLVVFLRKLSHCWWWRLRDATTATLTELKTDLGPFLA